MKLKHLRPKYAASFLRCIAYKVKYRGKLRINPFKVYLGCGARIRIGKGGRVTFRDHGNRIYIDCQCDLGASGGGTLELWDGVFLNRGCSIEARSRVTIGRDTMLGPYVRVFDNDHGTDLLGGPFRNQTHVSSPIDVGSNVWIGSGAFVCKETVIGDSSVIGANSVARGTLNARSVYAGCPARLIRQLGEEGSRLIGQMK